MPSGQIARNFERLKQKKINVERDGEGERGERIEREREIEREGAREKEKEIEERS